MVFRKLREHKLYLREEKCKLFVAKVNCLGHMIDEKGLHTIIYLHKSFQPTLNTSHDEC